MNIVYRTNLDEPQRDIGTLNSWNFKSEWSPIPRNGERVIFPFKKDGKPFTFELEVVAVNYVLESGRVEVELHIPSWQKSMTLREWIEWFKQHRYGGG